MIIINYLKRMFCVNRIILIYLQLYIFKYITTIKSENKRSLLFIFISVLCHKTIIVSLYYTLKYIFFYLLQFGVQLDNYQFGTAITVFSLEEQTKL